MEREAFIKKFLPAGRMPVFMFEKIINRTGHFLMSADVWKDLQRQYENSFDIILEKKGLKAQPVNGFIKIENLEA